MKDGTFRSHLLFAVSPNLKNDTTDGLWAAYARSPLYDGEHCIDDGDEFDPVKVGLRQELTYDGQ